MSDRQGSIFANLPRVAEQTLAAGADLHALFSTRRPVVIKGLVQDWPLVQAGLNSAQEARQYLLDHHVDRPFAVSIGAPKEEGRIFYRDDMALNVETVRAKLPEVFDRIDKNEDKEPQPIIYLASVDLPNFFPGLQQHNPIGLNKSNCLASIWIGLRTRIAAHNDFPDNLACVAVGRRRFTLFPPDQFSNLYLGPIDNTPAGRAVSMVDFHNPDFDAHPRFRTALEHATVAELSPGDAIHIPSMWWHHIEGLEKFNVLVNYWWRDTPRHLGQPQDALNHAIMSIRDLPHDERQIWRDLFDYYVFNYSDDLMSHIPQVDRSILGPMTPEQAGKIRAFLLRALNQ